MRTVPASPQSPGVGHLTARQTECLACGEEALVPCLDLGDQPPANLLAQTEADEVSPVPLALQRCGRCGHGQLSHVVPPDLLFRHYLYRSGTSGTLLEYFRWFCGHAETMVPKGGRVLEIAANDGSLLELFAQQGFECTGVDPAENIVAESTAEGMRLIADFFPTSAIEGERFDLMVGLNVLAHTPDPLAMLRGVATHLNDAGVAVFQTSQARMLERGEFDTVYHEHYSFFTPESLRALANRAGLHVHRTSLTAIHGTSFVFVLSRDAQAQIRQGAFETGQFALDPEESRGALETVDQRNIEPLYARFAATARARMTEVREAIEAKRSSGYTIVMVGVAAKAITFARAAGLTFDLAVDEAPEKVGLFVPGLGLQISHLRETNEVAGPTLFVLTAWNFATELERKVRAEALDAAPEFLTYFPTLKTW